MIVIFLCWPSEIKKKWLAIPTYLILIIITTIHQRGFWFWVWEWCRALTGRYGVQSGRPSLGTRTKTPSKYSVDMRTCAFSCRLFFCTFLVLCCVVLLYFYALLPSLITTTTTAATAITITTDTRRLIHIRH